MAHRSRPAALLSLLLLIWSQAGAQSVPQERKVSVTVDAKQPWVDSGLTVRKGERVSFEANGTIRWGDEPGQIAGPEGHDAKPGKLGKAGLIGRVGGSGKPFAIGRASDPIVMPKSGELFLGINDFIFADNSGAFTVVITQVVSR